MDKKKIVEEYYLAWETCNRDKLRLADDLKHISPEGTYTSSKSFLDDCWQYAGLTKYEDLVLISEGNIVCTRYNMPTGEGKMPVCEWLTIEDDLIKEIHTFFSGK